MSEQMIDTLLLYAIVYAICTTLKFKKIKHREQVALVSSRAHKAWYLAGLCLEITPIPPQQVSFPCAFCWGFQHLSLCLRSLPPTGTSHIDSWFFRVTKIMCPSLWN